MAAAVSRPRLPRAPHRREALPTHIDTTLSRRAGDRAINPSRPCTDGQPGCSRKWLEAGRGAPVRAQRSSPSRDEQLDLDEHLMLDERTAVVEAAETPMIALMRLLGCEVIPCPFDRVMLRRRLSLLHCGCSPRGNLAPYFPGLMKRNARRNLTPRQPRVPGAPGKGARPHGRAIEFEAHRQRTRPIPPVLTQASPSPSRRPRPPRMDIRSAHTLIPLDTYGM
jgi:hypothetical protein